MIINRKAGLRPRFLILKVGAFYAKINRPPKIPILLQFHSFLHPYSLRIIVEKSALKNRRWGCVAATLTGEHSKQDQTVVGKNR